MNDYEKLVSGITQLSLTNLSGKGVIVAILDSGIDIWNPEFQKSNGKTRIIGFLDIGNDDTFYSEEDINEALLLGYPEGMNRVNVTDFSGHGTAVASVACGNSGVATNADILAIKLANRNQQMLTTSLMKGVSFAVKFAAQRNQPLVLNISIGSTYGNHQGSSLLARFMDNAAEIGRTSIIVGSGNEGNARGHYVGVVNTRQTVELAVSRYETGLTIQIYKYLQDEMQITLKSPDGEQWNLPETKALQPITSRYQNDQTQIIFYTGAPLPYHQQQELLIELIPNAPESYITSGIWEIQFQAKKIVTGQIQIYLTGGSALQIGTGFFSESPEGTFTIPSTASKVISVGAYDVYYNRYAEFSGRGFVTVFSNYSGQRQQLITSSIKPDLVAPGVNISVAKVGGGYENVSGTSFAAPFVSGSAAILMEWGIINGFDPYLYGEKIKAYLVKNVKPLSGEVIYPNERVGWGALFVSLPVFASE